jgi:hypothetical protein
MLLRRLRAVPMVVNALMAERMGTLSWAPSKLSGKLFEGSGEEEDRVRLLGKDSGDVGIGLGRQHMPRFQ